MKYSASIKQTLQNWLGFTPSQNYKTTSAKLYDYGNILLKTYIEIATNGDFNLLVISGSATKDELIERWESIVQENGTRNGDNHYNIYFNLLKGYAEVIAEHTIVEAMLTILWYSNPVPFDVVNDVRERGYVIDTTTSALYAKSLKAAQKKVKNLSTKTEMKRKEIERIYGKKESKGQAYTYEEIIGHLELSLERSIMDSETLTLAKYNVLKKGIENKHRNERRRDKHK